MSLVSFVKIRSSSNQMSKAILDSLDLIQYQFPKNIQNVAIKPNMCYYWDYSTGQTTDPDFVSALVDVIRDQVSSNVDVSVVESDASAMECKHAFKILGYEKMARRIGVALVNLSEDESERVEVTAGGQSFHFMLPRTIKNADLLVNVPKIKYLEQTGISCALKNIFGCNPYPNKYKYHQKLDQTIVALNKVMKTDLCIVDGNIVSGVHPRRLGLVMASQDLVALDASAARIAGVNVTSIRHIMLASREGLGNTSFISRGIAPDYFESRYPRRGALSRVTSLWYKVTRIMNLGKRLGLDL